MRNVWRVAFLLMLVPALASAQSIVSVVPNTGTRGTSVGVQITGSETVFFQDSEATSIVWLSQGATRIDATTVEVTSAILLNATFDIPGGAPLGLYDVNAEQVVGGVVTLAGGFTVLGGTCAITDLAAGTQSACDPGTNTYTQQVIVTFENAPPTGNLVVNTQSFAIGTSPQTVTLTNLTANGAAVAVTANFSAEAECSRTELALFTAPTSCAVAVCAITDLAAGAQTACDPPTNSYTQEVVVTFENAPATGNLVVNTQSFAIGTSPQTVTLTNLTANGAAVDVTASFSAEPGCSRTETALFTAPVSCAVGACAITDLAAGTQTACDPATNRYTQQVIVTFENPPATGNLVVNAQSFAIGTSPQTVTLTNLTADGAAVDVTASFSVEPGCSRTETALYTAPVSCAVGVCAISDLAAGKQTPCEPLTNTYTQQVIVTFDNPPATGNLVVNTQSFAIGASPQTVTLINLVANGAAVDVTASFSAEPGCSRTETALFTAPVSCEMGACAITDLAAGTQTACNPATNTYTQQVIVTFENPPSTGNLVVNTQSFAIGTSPQTVTLTNLTANGAAVNVTASFSAEPGCSRTETALFTAPASCAVGVCAITDLAAGTQTACDPATNTYTQQVIVTFENPPSTGNLVVNGQSFAIGTSPQTVTLVGLSATGNPVNVTARFSAEPECQRTETALFTAPQACGAVELDCSHAKPSKKTLWPPNHRFQNVSIKRIRSSSGGEIEVAIDSVTSDEPTDGRGDGDTCPDAVIRADGTVDLRAERSSHGNGRVYTIHFTATDGTGVSCTGTVFVCVPKERGDDDDDDGDDDDKYAQPRAAGDEVVDGGHRDRDRDRDRDCDRRRDDDDDKNGDRDHRRGRCRSGRCIRDEVQYDATLCDAPKVALSGSESTSLPLVAWDAGSRLDIRFTAKAAGPVDVRIYDLRGRLVQRLAVRDYPAGQHALQWNGHDTSGHKAASGIYLVRVLMAGESHTAKAVWMH